MCSMAKAFVTALICVAPGAAQPDYFPLHVGDQWIYRVKGIGQAGATLTLEVTRAEVLNGRYWHLISGFPEGDYWVRMDEDGSLVSYDPDLNAETLWYAFQSPEGDTYPTSLPGVCCGLAMVASRNAEYRGPIGWFDYALEIQYPGVFQVGIERDVFLPYVGLVHRTQATGGPTYAVYDLIYSSLGGVTYVSEAEVSFGLTLDRSVYVAGLEPPVDLNPSVPRMIARLTLRNTGDEPVSLVFPSGQDYDLVIRDENGETVYRWSEGRFFTAMVGTVMFGPGEKNFALLIPLADKGGNPLPAGRYTAEAWLATTPPAGFSASAAFEIRHSL